MLKSYPKHTFFWLISACLVGWAFFLTVFLAIVAPVSHKRTDYNPTLFGLKAAFNHENPYSQALATRLQQMEIEDDPDVTPAQLAEVGAPYTQPFLYPLAPSLLFAPFSFLPPEVAAFAMRFINLALYLCSIPLLFATFFLAATQASVGGGSRLRFRNNILLLMVLIVALGGPLLKVIWPIIQLSGTVLFLLALIVFCLYRRHYEWAGALGFLILSKPQVGVVALADLAFFGLLVGVARWRLLKGFLLAAIPLSLVAFWLEPNWIGDWLEAIRKIGETSKSYQISYVSSLGVIGIGLALFLVILCGWVWLKAAQPKTDGFFYLGLALSVSTWAGLVVVPRTGNYDLIFGYLPLIFCLYYFCEIPSSLSTYSTYSIFVRRLGVSIVLGATFLCSVLYLLLDRNTVFLLMLLVTGLALLAVGLHRYFTSRNPSEIQATV